MGLLRFNRRWISYAIVAAVSGLAVSGSGDRSEEAFRQPDHGLLCEEERRSSRREGQNAASVGNARSRGRRTAFEAPEASEALAGRKATPELAAQPAQQELRAPNGAAGSPGSPGANGTARAYAEVNDVSNDYVAARTNGFTGTVTKPSVDYGHLLPNPRSHAGDRPVDGRGGCIAAHLATPLHTEGQPEVRVVSLQVGSCSQPTDFAVHTYDSGGVASEATSC